MLLFFCKKFPKDIDFIRNKCYNCIIHSDTVRQKEINISERRICMIVLDFKSSKPIYEQIIEQVKFHVIKGHLKPGDAIPSVRKLALDISITPGTVAKAYQELERQRIIETIRGKGTFIAGKIEMKLDDERMKECKKLLRSTILELKVMGLSEADVTDIVKDLYKEMSVC